jgi:hypothetical protein
MSMIERRMYAMTHAQFYQALSEYASRDLGRPVKVSHFQYALGSPHFVDLLVEEAPWKPEPPASAPVPATEAAP